MVCVEFKLIHRDGGQGWAWSSMGRLVDMEKEGEKAWGLLTMSWGCSNNNSSAKDASCREIGFGLAAWLEDEEDAWVTFSQTPARCGRGGARRWGGRVVALLLSSFSFLLSFFMFFVFLMVRMRGGERAGGLGVLV
jgi:hypothetical protein